MRDFSNTVDFHTFLISLMDSLLSWSMILRTPTSNGMKSTEKPAAWISLTRDEYLLFLCSRDVVSLSYQGAVNSIMVM